MWTQICSKEYSEIQKERQIGSGESQTKATENAQTPSVQHELSHSAPVWCLKINKPASLVYETVEFQ